MTELDHMAQQELPTIEEVRRYVTENVVGVSDGRKCVDGRYRPDEEKGMIARPGGDLGYVMVLMALRKDLTPRQAFDAVYGVVTRKNGQFFFHSDTHSEDESFPILGCRHGANPTDPDLSSDYELDPEKVTELIKYAKEKAKTDPKVKMVVLGGKHMERAVLQVMETQHSVTSSNDNGEMYFLYDAKRDGEFIDQELVPNLGIEGVSADSFKEVSGKQTMATLRNLAMGKPIYQVNFNKIDPVKFVGKVE